MRPPDDLSPAEAVFAAWLTRRETGEAESVEELTSAHPDLARELDALAGEWRTLTSGYDELDRRCRRAANGRTRVRPAFVAWIGKVLRRR